MSYGLPPILCHYMRLNVLDIEYNSYESDQRAEQEKDEKNVNDAVFMM